MTTVCSCDNFIRSDFLDDNRTIKFFIIWI